VKDVTRILVVVTLASGLALFLGCGGQDEPGSEAGNGRADGAQAGDGQAFGIGKPAPDFALKDTSGQQIRLSDHRGKAVVVDFWATWCGPCRRVMPTLQALSEDYPEQLSILAVSVDQDPAAVVPAFAEQNGLTFTLLADPEGMRVAQQWGGIRSIPTSFLVAPDGTVVKQWVGVHGREEYESEIRKVLGLTSS